MTRELYIDNQRVDLPEDVRFQLTFQIADFGELKPRGSGSNTIKLPKTPRNIAIFDNCNFVQVSSNFPYALHSAYYYEDGWLLFNDATVYMLAITEEDFEIQCVWGNSTEIKRLKSTDMGNVTGLGNVNYQPVTYGYIETGMREEYGIMTPFALATASGLRAPYTRGLLPIKSTIDNLLNPLYTPPVQSYLTNLYAFPAVSKAKITYDNVEFSGNINNQFFKNKSGTTPILLPSDSSERKELFIPVAVNGRTITTQGGTPFDGIVAPFAVPGQYYDVTIELFGINIVADYRNNKVKVIGPSVFVFGQILASDDNSQYTVETSSNIVMNIDEEWRDNSAKTYTATKRIFIDNTEVEMGNGVSAIPQLYCALWPTRYSQDGFALNSFYVTATVKITMSAVQSLTEVEINMPDERNAGVKNYVTVGMTDILRGTNAYEFITQCVINSGAIFDVKDGRTRLFAYGDVVGNAAEMLDWSDKLVYIKEESTFNHSCGSQNEIKYKQTEYYNGFGDGSFIDPLAQKLQKESKTVVANSLFGFNNGVYPRRLGNAVGIPFVFETQEKDGTVNYECKDRGWNLVRLANGTITRLADGDGWTLGVYYPVNPVAESQPTFANIRQASWDGYINLQNKYRKATALFVLSGQDIAELDFKKPIYLRQYAQAYVVTKINYRRNASTVEMLLIRDEPVNPPAIPTNS